MVIFFFQGRNDKDFALQCQTVFSGVKDYNSLFAFR